MGTETSRQRARRACVLGILIAAIGLAACGAAHQPTPAGAFSGLRPQAPPNNWKVARIPSGSEFAYPPTWSPQRGDRGTATEALLGSGATFLGYLNLTPRQGNETLADWASFRVEHNRDEGDRSVTRLASATGVRFLTGHGSCVKDSYVTQSHSRFVEIACLVAGAHAESVIVGAAPPSSWAAQSGVLERAISGLRT